MFVLVPLSLDPCGLALVGMCAAPCLPHSDSTLLSSGLSTGPLSCENAARLNIFSSALGTAVGRVQSPSDSPDSGALDCGIGAVPSGIGVQLILLCGASPPSSALIETLAGMGRCQACLPNTPLDRICLRSSLGHDKALQWRALMSSNAAARAPLCGAGAAPTHGSTRIVLAVLVGSWRSYARHVEQLMGASSSSILVYTLAACLLWQSAATFLAVRIAVCRGIAAWVGFPPGRESVLRVGVELQILRLGG